MPPYTTHAIQPLDVSFFKSLKAHWSTACHLYMVNNPGRVVTKFPSPRSAITEFLTCPGYNPSPSSSKQKASAPSSGARVLTSAQSLAMMEEKQRKKRKPKKRGSRSVK